MENGNGGVNQSISSDDVISKLKDDGDFDRLRVKIIRKIKENEDLRNNIVSIVRQSVAINRLGAENTKTRQLSDAIHQEVGGKLNEQISVMLWEIIRSPDGMKTEITETVKSVYDKLLRPKRAEKAESAGHDLKRARVAVVPNQTVSHPIDVSVHDLPVEERREELIDQTVEVLQNDSSRGANDEQGDGSDDDLDAPPGFG
ncbi:hypothetical protein SSX86_021477 [Deinandra increscens subsp. villosa]|uniref:Uncharacterized protein n=1 Tax=Deinandra increscens subsp. villosa TaxID=3103831 RepID=A0AAP0CRG5_9ASTR